MAEIRSEDAGRRVGEVIGADSSCLQVQCYELYGAPPLGSLVEVSESAVYAVVQSVRTEPLDPVRPVLARGRHAATVDEVYQDNPQIERLLTTRFEALVAGHTSQGKSRQLLPPVPPRIHDFVSRCSPARVAEFTGNMDFLRLLLNSGQSLADEVVVACLREAALCHPDQQAFLVRAGRALAAELPSNVARLGVILRRIKL